MTDDKPFLDRNKNYRYRCASKITREAFEAKLTELTDGGVDLTKLPRMSIYAASQLSVDEALKLVKRRRKK